MVDGLRVEITFGIMESDMDKVLYFNNDNGKKDYCSGQVYYDFIDYAFDKADYFMLVYANYYGKYFTEQKKHFKEALKPYEIKTRNTPNWPGTLNTFCPDTTYEVVFYKTEVGAKKVLKEHDCLSAWTSPNQPEDLAFFKGGECWFYSVGHEKIAAIIHLTDEDERFLEIKKLANRKNAFLPEDDYFKAFDEFIEA